MSELIKPSKKGKNDGVVDYLTNDDDRFLTMRGDYTLADIIQAAVAQSIIDSDSAEEWSKGQYSQSWYKTSPVGGQEGYALWHHPRDTPCRGAYFASILIR